MPRRVQVLFNDNAFDLKPGMQRAKPDYHGLNLPRATKPATRGDIETAKQMLRDQIETKHAPEPSDSPSAFICRLRRIPFCSPVSPFDPSPPVLHAAIVASRVCARARHTE